jgi:HNH endonuclease
MEKDAGETRLAGNKEGGVAMAIIKLTKGHEVIVDDEDFERINAFNWYALEGSRNRVYGARNYTRRNGQPRRTVLLHHQVLDIMPWELNGMVTDHIDRNTLNCRRNNLRIVPQTINAQNALNVINKRGVSYWTARRKWKAYYTPPGKNTINLGVVETEEEALALVAAAKEKYQC